MASKPDLRPAAQYLRVSSEMQLDSLAHQAAQVAQFAEAEGYHVVRTYADEGRSGLRLQGREALQQLLADVLRGPREFSAILIQDVSRWGRFQDPDEAAHYEFLCRQAGVEVRYCREAFDNSPSPTSGILKAVKRLMAAEFSRELSGKVRSAQFARAAEGFKMGGVAGYGLRRCAVDREGRPKDLLGPGERALLQSDRVVLVLGPDDEVETVRRIYRLYLHGAMTLDAIADLLNAEGKLGEGGRPWGGWTIGQVLGNPKYVGDYTFGRRRRTLDGRRIDCPPEAWLRVEACATPIVSREMFEAVRRKRQKRMLFLTEPVMLERAATLLARDGRLSLRSVEAARDLPSPRTLCQHFGPLNRLQAKLGYYPLDLARFRTRPVGLTPGYIDEQTFRGPKDGSQERFRMAAQTETGFTAFAGITQIMAGPLLEVVRAVKRAEAEGATKILVFDDATGQVVDLDLRGDLDQVIARLLVAATPEDAPTVRGRGRPKLGVAAREVTLLPRHWTWLARQPGGASAAIRKLVEQAARESVNIDAARDAQTAAYKAMYALAGHLPHFEDALRALFAWDLAKVTALMADWPADVTAYLERLMAVVAERNTAARGSSISGGENR